MLPVRAYEVESSNHPEAQQYMLDKKDAVRLIKKLCRSFNLQPIKTVFLDQRDNPEWGGFFHPVNSVNWLPYIELYLNDFGQTSILTVVHEFAHYRHSKDWSLRKFLHPHLRKEKDHGPVFNAMVDECLSMARVMLDINVNVGYRW